MAHSEMTFKDPSKDAQQTVENKTMKFRRNRRTKDIWQSYRQK